ncbi:N-6 DNA methylase [Exiguobacterium sp. s7]|uniref:N-6 DNA methylase n=1 Tax=Exiguobacterium sp. s7 TaxID=2751235 RepID=UPI001BEA7366|nr:N-6 DNA methylase [Exiguobacterium sp. s7]
MIDLSTSLWKISNVLRGYVGVLEYKHVLASTMTVKYMEADDKFVIPEAAKWSNIVFTRHDLKNVLMNAFKEIEMTNPKLGEIFATKSLAKLDEQTVDHLISFTNHMEVTPEVFNAMLYYFASNEGKAGGEFITPYSLAKLLPSLLNVRNGEVYDGTAGASLLLTEAAKYAEKHEQKAKLFGQEINPTIYALGKMNLIINGMDHEYALGNTLLEPAFVEGQLKKFDYVLMNFPFSLKNWGNERAEYDLYNRYKYGMPSNSNADMAFIQHAIASLKEDGKAALIVTHGTLFRGGADRKIRQALLKEDLIEAIIGLPSNLFFTTNIPVAILILNKNKSAERKGKIQFINAQDHVEKTRGQNVLRAEDQHKIISAYQNIEEIKQYSMFVSIEDIEDANLNIAHYFTEDNVDSIFGNVLVNKNTYENASTPKVELKELATIIRGMNTPPKKDLEQQEGDYHLLQLADVQDGKIQFQQLNGIDLEPEKVNAYEVKEGDILLSSRGTAIKIAIVPALDRKLIASHNFIIIRPNDNVNSYFIKSFLESPIGTYYISSKQKGTAVTVLSVKDIESILLPEVDMETQNELGEQFLNADNELAEVIRLAKEKYGSLYYELYEKMGLTTAFKTLD